MNYFLSILFLAFLSVCNGQTAIRATSQSWAAGRCCDRGTNYDAVVFIESPVDQISVEEIWVKGHGWLPGTITADSANHSIYHVHFSDIQNGSQHGAREMREEESPEISSSINDPVCDCEAILYLNIDGKMTKVEIPYFRILPPEKRP